MTVKQRSLNNGDTTGGGGENSDDSPCNPCVEIASILREKVCLLFRNRKQDTYEPFFELD